ncbi:MAG: O-antigen ligase family protein, partial [Candidatus Saccharimonadales bacterium]
MNTLTTTAMRAKLPKLVATLTTVIVVILPFHAFLTVWLSSVIGHYTVLRLWKELVLLVMALACFYLLVIDKPLRRKLFESRLNQAMVAYAALTVLWALVVLLTHKVSTKAVGYGLIVDLRFIAFFVVVWVTATKAPKSFKVVPNWLWWPLAVVVVFGLLQYFVLPYDFLKHFGYGEQTIFPYETINHDVRHVRVMSMLRGANPLGAYLVLTLSLLFVAWKKQLKNWQTLLLAGGVGVLFLSFSRSAWIGMLLSIGVILWATTTATKAKQRSLAILAAAAIVLMLGGLALRHNTTLQDYVFHTNDKSTIKTSSNQGHASALRSGLHDIATEPLGRGPGSAGPASVYNTKGSIRIAENYFIQVGQETGWPGLFFFLLINIYLARELWRRRQHNLALGMLAALVGLTFVNLLSHAWADDTLAYMFWGLAA